MCQICQVIGQHDILLRPGEQKLEEWIDCEFDDARKPILDRIRKTITYYLGNTVEITLLSKAAEALFNRDYKDKKHRGLGIVSVTYIVTRTMTALFGV